MYAWTEDLSVGVETIDSQHRELFQAFNSLLRDEGKAAPEEVPWLLGFLEEYVVNHFGMEELYMRRYSYPGYLHHKNEHVTFINDFYDLRDEMDAHGVNDELTGKISSFVGGWLVNHIGKTDRALGNFLKDKPRKLP